MQTPPFADNTFSIRVFVILFEDGSPGFTDMLYVSELVGAILMYIGFTLATTPSPVTEAAAAIRS